MMLIMTPSIETIAGVATTRPSDSYLSELRFAQFKLDNFGGVVRDRVMGRKKRCDDLLSPVVSEFKGWQRPLASNFSA
jgi:hypothetical protein